MAERFLSITTAVKRAKLEDAWDAAPAEANTFRQQIRSFVSQNSALVDGVGGISSSASNGHSVSAFAPGQNQASGQEFLEMWQELLDMFDLSAQFLRKCAKYGLDAFTVKFDGFPCPLPTVANPQITIDTTGRWAVLCETYNIGQADVINAVVGDETVYLWMLDKLFPVTECQGDYTWMRITSGPQYA